MRLVPASLWLVCMLNAAYAYAATSPLDNDDANAQRSGDLLQWGIPLVGLGLTFLLDGNDEDAAYYGDAFTAPGVNWPGPRLNNSLRHDFVVSFMRMEVTTYALKYTINAKRPTGAAHSFPSGHTASAFMGAEFIRKHYGLKWGIPAYATAAWVGYSRVESDQHYWRDVIGGAVIGIASNYDLGMIDTPLGQLSFGPRLMTPTLSQHECAQTELPGCFRGQPVMLPGLGFELKFK